MVSCKSCSKEQAKPDGTKKCSLTRWGPQWVWPRRGGYVLRKLRGVDSGYRVCPDGQPEQHWCSSLLGLCHSQRHCAKKNQNTCSGWIPTTESIIWCLKNEHMWVNTVCHGWSSSFGFLKPPHCCPNSCKVVELQSAEVDSSAYGYHHLNRDVTPMETLHTNILN